MQKYLSDEDNNLTRMCILGHAGHGKSTLVEALQQIIPNKLECEKLKARDSVCCSPVARKEEVKTKSAAGFDIAFLELEYIFNTFSP